MESRDELCRLRQENAQLRRELNVYKGISANSFFMRALRGQTQADEDIREGFRKNGLDFPGERFAVVIFQISDGTDLFFEGKGDDAAAEAERIPLVNFVLENISTELLNRRFFGKTVYGDGNMPCIVCLDDNWAGAPDREAEEAIRDVTEEIISVLLEKTGIIVCASLGRVYSGYDGLARSYSEADRVVKYRALMELKTPLIHFSDISHENMSKPDRLYSMDQEQRLLNCIRHRDYRKAKEHMQELFQSYFTGYVPSIQFLQCRFWGFLSNMISMIDEFDEAGDAAFMGEIDPIGRLLEAENISQLHQQIDYIFDCFIERMESRKRTEPPKWLGPMMDYIKENFSNPDLNVSTVSAKFDIHPSYAAQIFKQCTGERMLDYIHRLRIDSAKELMAQGLPISDIASRVGYSSGKAMVREFKKYEGTVPSSFKPV